MKRDLGSCQQRLETRHESKDLFQHNIFYGALEPKDIEFSIICILERIRTDAVERRVDQPHDT